ncbi:MAG: SDR family oxidoreductase [Mesorhizobium sp.]
MKIFIFGAGYSGRAFARRMAGRAEWIAGTTRSADKLDALARDGMRPVLFDGAVLSDEARALLAETTHLVISAGPQNGEDPVLAAARATVLSGMPSLEWIGYLSTVGVYGDHDGAWVTEESECRPSAQRSTERLKAENGWLDLGRARGVPVAVLRLSGIYGPGRNALVNLASGTAKRVIREGQVFNRIHVADIAAALEHLGERGLGGVYNVSDDRPCPPQDVITFAAGLMGVAPPPEVRFEDAEMSPMALSFWSENKRVSNAKIRATGFDFGYPDHETALTRMWREDDWRGEPDEVRTTRRKLV